MSKKPSHIPLFPDAYLRDTTHLTTEEHGAYFLLLMAAWGSDDCALPYDERRLAALAKLPVARWRKIAPTVLEFWTIDKGRITQKRLTKERAYVDARSGKRKDAANARWQSKSNANAYAFAYANGMHLGGGGGGGGGITKPVEESYGEVERVREGAPFRVMDGGAK